MPTKFHSREYGIGILWKLALLSTSWMLLPCMLASAQPDNRYCDPGNHAKFGDSDGPAALPRSCFFTASSATPSPGQKINVRTGSDLQQAIDRAQCGETLELAAGAAFEGSLNFPAKGCDDTHWITVQTDGKIPPEGTRISPCYAGVRSLPGRPDFSCSSPSKEMASLVVPAHATIRVADHYRFIGLEITRPQGGLVNSLISAQNASKVVFDRIWAHGNDSDETLRGIGFPGANFIAVIDSYFSDFHCIAKIGACVDAQTLWAGTGDVAGGTYKIVNNFLEAGAENILMGGGAGSATPSDLEIRRNYFYKPLTWHTSSGRRFIVKNNLELKNASRVLMEGDLFENSWGGFSQAGFQILLTPKNQSNLCAMCVVRDVTIRYCVLRHSGAGIQLSAGASDSGGLSQGMVNISIHDVLIQDINAGRYDGNGITFQISTSGGAFGNISIRHNTVPVSDTQLLIVGSERGRSIPGMVLADNILGVGRYQVMSTGGHMNCAFQKVAPKDIFDACWSGYNVNGNLLIGGFDRWPEGNHPVKDLESLGFSGDATELGSLKLPLKSQYREKTEDGKDPGADIERIQSNLAKQ